MGLQGKPCSTKILNDDKVVRDAKESLETAHWQVFHSRLNVNYINIIYIYDYIIILLNLINKLIIS